MCGICGIFGKTRDSQANEVIVAEMAVCLAHRGPDGDGFYAAEDAFFGHRRLSIIDLERGSQPMHSSDGRYTLNFNGEIYNYVELRQNLIQQGAKFQTFSDTEVLLQLLIRDKERALQYLNGMFAFAFYDGQTRQWLLAVDPFGIKPLYYVELDGELVFASEIKALLLHPKIHAKSNWKGLQHYLTFQFCLQDETLFEGIKKIEPGCHISGQGADKKELVRYWEPDFTIDEHHTEAYFIDHLLTLLEDSARLQIRSDVPLGAYLSGGLDSTIVSTMASNHLGRGLPAFTGKFEEGPAYDESPYARLVADHIHGDLHQIMPTAHEFVELLPKIIYHLDEPVAGPGLFPQFMVSRIAAEHVKVMLGGQGGDEVFGGYARYLVGYLEQVLKGAIFETQEEGKHLVTLSSIIPNLPLLKQYQPLMQHFWQSGLFDDMDTRYFRLIDRTPDLEQLLTPEAKAAFDHPSVFADFQAVFNGPRTKSYFNKMTQFDMKTLLPALLQIEDRVSMAVSLESRVPLLDTRIVDLVTRMPPQMKFQGGKTKYILKKAVSNVIPQQILDRKDKMGFPVPLQEWMAQSPVRDFVCDILLSKTCRERGLYEPQALERLIHSEGRFGRQIWGALCMELWHQRFIDNA